VTGFTVSDNSCESRLLSAYTSGVMTLSLEAEMNTAENYIEHPDPVVLKVELSEHFDYRSIHRFRNLCTEKMSTDVHVVVDMAATRYVDSSGVALLHCLQKWINAPMVIVQVVNCCPEMRRILSSSRLSHHILID
jgi:anti-anti-sigma factor